MERFKIFLLLFGLGTGALVLGEVVSPSDPLFCQESPSGCPILANFTDDLFSESSLPISPYSGNYDWPLTKPSKLTSLKDDIAEVKNTKDTRFQVKHVYLEGNSYWRLQETDRNVRRYLIEMNKKMFKEQILPPHSTAQFNRWLDEATPNPNPRPERPIRKKLISLIDADDAVLGADIRRQDAFKQYMRELDEGSRVSPIVDSTFTTKGEYPVTNIEFTYSKTSKELEVRVERFKAKVHLGMNREEVYHYGGLVETTRPVGEPVHVTTFSRAELENIARKTTSFWEKIFHTKDLMGVDHKGPLNVDAKRFKVVENNFRGDWSSMVANTKIPMRQLPGACNERKRGGRGKRSLLGEGEMHCAFYLNREDEVVAIDAEEFLHVYEEQGDKGKKQMTDLVKEHGDKVTLAEEQVSPRVLEEFRQKVNEKVVHEEIRAHVTAIETVAALENLERWKGPLPERAYQMLEEMHEKLAYGKFGRIRLSASKIAENLADHRYVKKFTTEVGHFAEPYGRLFLAGTVISGILHNDTTSLAIIGSRVGYDILAEKTFEIGTKYFSEASKMGKFARFLGEVAGPIGSLLDVGIGGWLMSKSVDRLKNATDGYERDDAIADIVSGSVDIAVTVGALGLSLAFPPAAPFIMAAAFLISVVNNIATSMFHAINDVEKINAEVPLSTLERINEGTQRFFDFFGLREKDYVDYLYETKKANDWMAGKYEEFLKNNSDSFIGVVFPSERVPHGEGDEQPEPWKDSLVDLREKQTIWRDRDAPNKLEDQFEFRCRPGSDSDQGETVSVRDSENDFLCKHAATVAWKEDDKKELKRRLLVRLEDGEDTVYLSGGDTTPAQFWMGEGGNKRFFGGGGNNEFVFEGNCSGGLGGEMHGGPGEGDCVIIGPMCGKEGGFEVELGGGEGASGWIVGGNVNMSLGDIEEVVGRPKEVERVTVGCTTKYVALGGGKGEGEGDWVKVPKMECGLKGLQIVVENYTTFQSEEMSGNVTIVVPNLPTHVNLTLSRNGTSTPPSKTTTVFSKVASVNISLEQWEPYQDTAGNWTNLVLKFEEVNDTIEYHLDDHGDQLFYFNETTGNGNLGNGEQASGMSVLSVNTQDPSSPVPLTFYHTLGDTNGTAGTRRGCRNIDNVFNVTGADWSVEGGDLNDTFILYTATNVNVTGGPGENTLVLKTSSEEKVSVDLRKPEFGGSQWVKDIQLVVDGPGTILNLTTGCDTKLVNVQGGNDTDPDYVLIGEEQERCLQRNLQVQAGGHSKVVVTGDVGRPWQKDQIFVIASSSKDNGLHFEMETRSSQISRLFLQVEVTDKQWKVVNVTNDLGLLAYLEGVTGNESVKLNFTNAAASKLPFIQLKTLNSTDPPSQLVFREDPSSETPVATVLYNLDETHPKFSTTPVSINQLYDDLLAREITGFAGIPNMFNLANGSWVIRSGGLQNIFLCTGTSLVTSSLDGERGEKNTLVIQPDSQNTPESQKTLTLHLGEERASWNQDSQEGWLAGMHHIVARPSQPDHIFVDCDTKSVVGRGGRNLRDPDHVWILAETRDRCGPTEPLEIHVGEYTHVTNNQTKEGVFTYHVEDVMSTKLNLTASENNVHRVQYQAYPWQVLASTHYNDTTRQLRLQFKDPQNRGGFHTQKLNMLREGDTGPFKNPIVTFSPPGSGVAMEMQVGSQGQLETNYIVHRYPSSAQESTIRGLPVNSNRFLVNITMATGTDRPGKIRGSSRAKANQFFLINLPNTNQSVPSLTLQGSRDCYGDQCPVNSVNLDPAFLNGTDLVFNLDLEQGFIGKGSGGPENVTKMATLENMHIFHGRNDTRFYDTIYPDCATQQISGVENIQIAMGGRDQCQYNLLLSLDHVLTRVTFFQKTPTFPGNQSTVTPNNGSTFHYYFPRPMSFQVIEEVPGLLRNTSHNFLLPFKLTDLESLSFSDVVGRLYYNLKGDKSRYWISMISDPREDGATGQFYGQPNMITRDRFRLQVTRGGGDIILTREGGPDRHNSTEMFERYQAIARQTGATIIHQSGKELMHVGDGGYGDRNVLQNVKSHKSWLSGGGDPTAIYEIVALQKDVYIYPSPVSNVTSEDAVLSPKQTVDLTDIVVAIRVRSGIKFVPTVTQVKEDLVISMGSWQDRYPGRIFLKEATKPEVVNNLQILLSNSMMTLQRSWKDPYNPRPVVSWEMVPAPVVLEREALYSLAAQDLEYNQTVQVDQEFKQLAHFHFQIYKNGSNLHLSDIQHFKGYRYDENPPQKQVAMTTVIITDFYRDDGNASTTSHHHRSEREKNEKGSWSLPSDIRNVTLLLPGLKLRLQGTTITNLQNSSIIPKPSGDTKLFLGGAPQIAPEEIADWTGAVDRILQK